MPAVFSIDVDVPLNLVRMTLSGFFTPEDVARFVRERDDAHRLLLSAPNQHLTLVDMRGMQIQSQDAVTEFQRVLSSPVTKSRRIAFVVAKSLARLQIQRVAASRSASYFMAMDEAEAWLLAE